MTTFCEISEEVDRARVLFPQNRRLFAALVEEVGELAKALVENRPLAEIRAEAVQVACVAVRLIEEGDSTFEASLSRDGSADVPVSEGGDA
jgi:hypothetical protein